MFCSCCRALRTAHAHRRLPSISEALEHYQLALDIDAGFTLAEFNSGLTYQVTTGAEGIGTECEMRLGLGKGGPLKTTGGGPLKHLAIPHHKNTSNTCSPFVGGQPLATTFGG